MMVPVLNAFPDVQEKKFIKFAIMFFHAQQHYSFTPKWC
jgi:hypothetical protein